MNDTFGKSAVSKFLNCIICNSTDTHNNSGSKQNKGVTKARRELRRKLSLQAFKLLHKLSPICYALMKLNYITCNSRFTRNNGGGRYKG